MDQEQAAAGTVLPEAQADRREAAWVGGAGVSAEVVAIIGAAALLLAVLVPLMRYLHGRLAAWPSRLPAQLFICLAITPDLSSRCHLTRSRHK